MAATLVVLVATTASIAAASEPASQSPADCGTLAFLGLPCELELPPVPTVTLPLEPEGTEIVPPQLTDAVDEALSTAEQLPADVAELTESLPVDDILSVTEPPPPTGLLQPVTAVVAAPATNAQDGSFPAASESSVDSPQPESALHQATASSDTADARVHGQPKAASSTTAGGAGSTMPSVTSTALVDPDPVMASAGGLVGRIGVSLPAAPEPAAGVVALSLAIGGGASLAFELARGSGGGFASVIAFNVWLRRQLRETRMSQRQLAAFSGVDHSTISRLMSGERAPSLATATKLTKALHKLGGMPHAGDYFARLAEVRELPTRRVEAALLGDEELDDEDVRALMHAYVIARARRRRLRAAAQDGDPMPSEGPRPA